MKQILTILLLFFGYCTYSQEIDKKSLNPIKDINQPFNYKRFQGKISIFDNNKFAFDDKIFFIINTNDELKKIFEIGILYPEIIIEAKFPSEIINKTSELDSSIVILEYSGPKSFNSVFGSDSLTVSDFREIKLDHNSIKVKTFTFILFRNGLLNPTEYYIELYNDIAMQEMGMETYINGARLTLIWKGTLLI
jgi:hypothetical protein